MRAFRSALPARVPPRHKLSTGTRFLSSFATCRTASPDADDARGEIRVPPVRAIPEERRARIARRQIAVSSFFGSSV
jgi:hypothetical protein